MRQGIVFAMAFLMGAFACMAHGVYWLYPLLKAGDSLKGTDSAQGEWGFLWGLLVCLVLNMGLVITLNKWIGDYPFVEKGILLLLCLYLMIKEKDAAYSLGAQIPGPWQVKPFIKGFMLSIEGVAVDLLYLILYWMVLAINQTRKWGLSFAPTLLFGFMGLAAVFWMGGRAIIAGKGRIKPMAKPVKWKQGLLLFMVLGLFL